jgi:arylsulfatase A-like enzyme
MVKVRMKQNFIRQSAVRKGDWKYLRSYKFLGGGKFSDKYSTALYNLKDDIAEEKNLAATNPEKTKALSGLLDQWEAEMRKTAAPFPAKK